MGNTLTRRQKYTLLKLSNIFKEAEDIEKKILSRQYKEPLGIKGIPEDIEDEELNFYYKWSNKLPFENVSFENDEKMTFLVATANCEYKKQQAWDKSTGNLLPKKDRLNISDIDTIFVKFQKEWYCIISTFSFYDLQRVKKLIGLNNLVDIPTKFQPESELFHWLFYKYIREEYLLKNGITLENINGFTGMVVNEENYFEGRSDQTAELIITKAFIANRYPLNSMQIALNLDDAEIIFYLSESTNTKELEITIQKNSRIDLLLSSIDIVNLISMYVYFKLIPELVYLFDLDKSEFVSNEKDEFLSKIGIEVIKTVMENNNISIDDIK